MAKGASFPVVHRHTILGRASTETGAKRIAKRVLRPASYEVVTARMVSLVPLEAEDTYAGPAWAVGLQLRSRVRS